MNWIFYGFIGIGVILLLADGVELLIASPTNVRWLRVVGLIAATIVGFGPIVWLATTPWESWYPLLAIGYVVLYVAFAAGTLGRAGERSKSLQRVAYGGLLVLVALPPTVLLALAPLLALAGVALVRPDEREADRVTEFKSAALRPDPPREEE